MIIGLITRLLIISMYVSVLYSKKCKNLARGMIGVPKSLQGGCDGNLKDGSLPRVSKSKIGALK